MDDVPALLHLPGRPGFRLRGGRQGMSRALICFTRVPALGRTKTRLLPVLTGEQCARLHTAFLEDLAGAYAGADAALYVAWAGAEGPGPLEDIFPNAAFFPQRGAGLGERMDDAVARVLGLGHGACVLTGTDLPELTAGHLAAAFALLEQRDAAIGPTPDGGYYLVGLKRPCPELFRGKRYGGSTVFAQALAAFRAAGLSWGEAPPCPDVDTPEDLRALAARLAGGESRTARLLAELRKEGCAL